MEHRSTSRTGTRGRWRGRWAVLALAAALVVSLLPVTPAAAANTITVYYQPPAAWGGSVNVHYGVDGAAWTPVPGVAMEPACTGWRRKSIDLGAATGLQVVFTNGTGTWDNNNGANYRLGTGSATVSGGRIGSGDPCAASSPSPTPSGTPGGATAEVYYRLTTRGWSAANIHYRPTGGAWTTVPGTAMEVACAGWARKVLDLGSAGGLTAAFNNGAGQWDNNNGADYAIGTGRSTVSGGVVTPAAADPCGPPAPPDTTAPSVPTGLTATVDNVQVTLTWTASTDDRAVTGYEVTRTGGTTEPVTVTTTGTRHVANGLSPLTAYRWTVRARDEAGNRSAASEPVTAITGDAPPAPAGGSPLGGDPREDTIYFVMTARFADGDPSNNRGGSQHVRSGNAANDDPMFRGDFQGLIDKLDYIKALGFSALWITPVVLNRSDYDFHGYHGWDFHRVDPRLESPGASYQDLINAAHGKGIKIFQDVVYNHSSRWGAKGLFTPTVYGVRDEQWKWYYDQPQPGREYDPMDEHDGADPTLTAAQNAQAKGRPYNGDLWSSSAPEGNRCLRWGTPNGAYSREGYTVYHCQWPAPTSGLFPADLYHQCWIGNWEGEDSRSCWLHEDLADFNTENERVQQYLIDVYNKYIDMGVDGFRIDTAVHIPRVTWNRRFLPAIQQHAVARHGEKGRDFYVFGEVAAFVNDKWNRGSVNHSAQFFTWKERRDYSPDDVRAAIEQYEYEQLLGTGNQPTSDNAFLRGNDYHTPDHSRFSGMNVIDMRMHMNFGDANNAFGNGRDSDDSYNDATYNVVYVDSHDYGPNKSSVRYTGGTDAWAENMSLMWTFRGIPTLYYGSEIEFQKGAPIDCGPSCPLATTGRAYYGGHLAGSVTAADFGVVASASGTVAQTLDKPLVKHVQRLNQIRRAIPALQKGQYSTAGISGNQMAYKRRFTEGGVDSFALVTVSGSATFTGVPNGTYTDAVTGDVKVVTNGTLTASVSGKGNLRVYVLSLPGNPAPGKVGATGPYLR
ncbi:carbohydrate binding domain-containing protein [Verrucosispora sp. FIM060022]|uniref:carbohydrate binding domain-containing protein n=1 Tax=Verrucosispora sp. FIM060022 TaxID=1479020 RepID=UPI000F8602CA|nr:carbohydrate binding domain-containing protein [Verrucosispora sp. FIM060022]RUL94158.1 alpha-amylase [Verrucosispora sp. FIM060022]